MAAIAGARAFEAQSSSRSDDYSRIARGRRRAMLGLIVLAHLIVVWGLLQWRDVRDIEIMPVKVIVKIVAEPAPSKPESAPPVPPPSPVPTPSTPSAASPAVAPPTAAPAKSVGSATAQSGSGNQPGSR